MALQELRLGNGGDIPATPTSSVGEVVYPPVAASEKRKKGIYPSVISLPQDLMQATQEFASFPLDENASRIGVRYFVENGVLANLQPDERSQIAPYMEGIMKLEGDGEHFRDCSVVYLGKNAQERRTRGDVFEEEVRMVQEVFASPNEKKEYDYSGFTFKELSPADKADPEILSQYANLYKAFGWSAEQVTQIVQNPGSILLGAFVDGQLVSSGTAERAEFMIERGGVPHPFVMYEITEAATRSDYRGKGLYTKIATELMKHLATTDIDLLYGESNALSKAVITAAHALGRTSSIDTLSEFGFPPRFLEQHVRISAGQGDMRDPAEKNDLLPTYMTRHKLLQFANGK